ncbi:MAG: Tetratricopeptide repeat protein [Methanoregula sp. PtaU1.Bin051]|nr:MAG: Tetratricopeptide repeat protein [Methanoregula sp. PtaU1.Bin051]
MVGYISNIIPLEAQYRLRRGRELAARGEENGALTCFKQAAMIAPCYSTAFREIGNSLCRLGRQDDAAIYYKKALQMSALYHAAPFIKPYNKELKLKNQNPASNKPDYH